MDSEHFRRYGHQLIDWVADYMDHVDQYPVMSRVVPGETRNSLPTRPPDSAESMESILADFRQIIMPGITHWNHPRFFAYFPANNSGPSILGELLSAALGVNGMLWQTSPAATELEEVVMDWLRQMLDLPESFRGVIQDTASTATICALLCARERATGFKVNRRGFAEWPGDKALRVYTSNEAHSSVEKGMKIAGFGAANLVKVAVRQDFSLDSADLERKIREDLEQGLQPCCISATIGTTSSTAIDPLPDIGEIARRYGLWLHVDAALAGSAAILPEKRWILDGIEHADSLVFNPHKWLFTNFDCSAFFTRHPDLLTSVFSIQPEYLKTDRDPEVTNFRDWGIQLGRRFRALKLWFVIRSFGVDGLRDRLRDHLALAQGLTDRIQAAPDFELMAPVPLNTVCFRFRPMRNGESLDDETLDRINKDLMDELNREGMIFFTHTRLRNQFTLRLSIGQTRTEARHVNEAWQAIQESEIVRSWRQAGDTGEAPQ